MGLHSLCLQFNFSRVHEEKPRMACSYIAGLKYQMVVTVEEKILSVLTTVVLVAAVCLALAFVPIDASSDSSVDIDSPPADSAA